jgi:hypothetical protein
MSLSRFKISNTNSCLFTHALKIIATHLPHPGHLGHLTISSSGLLPQGERTISKLNQNFDCRTHGGLSEAKGEASSLRHTTTSFQMGQPCHEYDTPFHISD